MRNRKRIRRTRRGFTLIELMIVVAIIGILVAIAIPSFLRFQLKSKTTEAKANLAAIRLAEEAYHAEFAAYVAAAPSPAANGGTAKQAFVDVGAAGANFATIGWLPEGQVFFNYAVNATASQFTADASGDLDGSTVAQVWGYVLPDTLGASLVGTLGCAGVWDPATAMATIVRTLGPCGGAFGQSEF